MPTANNPNRTFTVSPDHVSLPVERDDTALVENVYAEPGTDAVPDYASADTMEEYLIDRLTPYPGPKTRLVWRKTGRSLPGIERKTVGYKPRYAHERDGWWISPKVAAAVTIGSFVLSIAQPAIGDVIDEVKIATHDVYRHFHPVEPRIVLEKKVDTEPGKVSHIAVDAEAGNKPGAATLNYSAIDQFYNNVSDARRDDGKIVNITVTGRSSDDYGTNQSIGRAEPAEEDFADERAQAYTDVLQEKFPGLQVHSVVDQNVLTPAEKAEIEQAAQDAGFTGPNNIIDAIRASEAGRTTPQLDMLVRELFTSRRGVTLDAEVKTKGKPTKVITYTPKEIPGEDNPPKNPDRDYDPFVLPLIPIPRLRKHQNGVKAKKKTRFTQGKDVFRPEILVEEEDQVWLRLRPEAKLEDNTLVQDAWAYTGKYEYLLRDSRIADVLRVDFRDQNAEKKSLRVMFIDKSPAQETIDEFTRLLKKFAAMENGALGDRVNAIFVYPSDTAGTAHGDPKQVNMGNDKQSSEHVLGTYTYALNLVEMHMPSTWDPAELEELFATYCGPSWTLAHEVSGHGTDDSDAALQLREARVRGIPHAHTISGDARAKKMMPLQHELKDLQPPTTLEPTWFDIVYPVPDRNGNVVTINARVRHDDPRLDHAISATIVGRKPTDYANSNVSEHYAETAAGVVTGIEIPYDQAGIAPTQLTTDEGSPATFAEGYHPDKRAQKLFTAAVGALEGILPIEFDHEPQISVSHIAPQNDPLIREEMIRTRTQRVLEPDEKIAILARVTQQRVKD